MTPRELVAAFEVVAEAPGGVDRLRELVLQLAVRGKLVPQDPEDEPASELLERIAAEKARLVEAGEIRKPKAVPPVSEDEVPFEVPAGWAWTRLDDVVDPERPISYGVLVPGPHVEGGTPLVRVAELDAVSPPLVPEKAIGQQVASEYERVRLRGDELLVGVVGSIGKIGKARPEWAGAVVARAVARFGVAHHMDRLFTLLVLQAPRTQAWFGEAARTMAQPTLNVSLLRQVHVPVPPLAEQHRIVAKVDELMALIDRLEATRITRESSRSTLRDAALGALRAAETSAEVEVAWARVAEQMGALFTEPADLEPLRQAVLQLAVRGRLVPQDPADEPASVLLSRIVAEKARLVEAGDVRKPKVLPPVSESERPFDVPRGWAWIEVETVTSLVTSGSRGWNQYYAETGATFIRSQDIKGDRLEYDQQVFVNLPERAEGLRTRVMRGDWLVTITGANVGKCALVTEPIDEGYVSQHVALLRPVETGIGPFGHLWLTSAHGGRGLLLNYSYGAKPGLNLSQLRELPMPLPPLAEQHRIVAKVDELMSLIDRLEEHLTAQATAHEAFAAAAVHHLDA